MAEAIASETTQYLSFKLADEVFALDIDKVFNLDELEAVSGAGEHAASQGDEEG